MLRLFVNLAGIFFLSGALVACSSDTSPKSSKTIDAHPEVPFVEQTFEPAGTDATARQYGFGTVLVSFATKPSEADLIDLTENLEMTDGVWVYLGFETLYMFQSKELETASKASFAAENLWVRKAQQQSSSIDYETAKVIASFEHDERVKGAQTNNMSSASGQ